jgi:hypothetical protein
MTTSKTSTVRRFLGLLGWVLLVPSALTALGAAWMLASGLGMLGGTQTATGRVVAHQDVTVGPSSRRGLARHSVVEFEAADGRTQRFTDAVARQNQAVHRIGETVTVRYDARDPSRAEIGGSTTVKVLGGGVLLLFSGVGVLAGWLLLRWRRKPGSVAAFATPD